MLKSNIDVFFCDVISLLARVFIVSFDRAYKEVSTTKILIIFCGSVFEFLLFHFIGHLKRCLPKKIENFLWLSFCDMTVPSKTNVPSGDLDL